MIVSRIVCNDHSLFFANPTSSFRYQQYVEDAYVVYLKEQQKAEEASQVLLLIVCLQ